MSTAVETSPPRTQIPTATFEVADWMPPSLVAGPVWPSFESFRKLGPTACDSIPQNGVGTLRTKTGVFRILHDADFQRVIGIAADVQRLQKGLRIVFHAARVCARHPDEDTVKLLVESALMITECPELPVCDGHDTFKPRGAFAAESTEDADFDTADIPTLKW